MTSGYETAGRQGAWGGGCGRMGWRPVEIGAMVLGFAVFWPLGLAVLAWKFAQKKGYAVPDVFGALNERFEQAFRPGERKPWRPFAESSGNAAFDDWRKAELERLEEERKKLDAAERDFAAHMDNLRRARDRDEFDRFMAARTAAKPD